jgi:serine/threonine-protein kinase
MMLPPPPILPSERHRFRKLAGRYKLREKLGQGTFAEVFLAKDTTDKVPVAVKLLHEPLSYSQRIRRLFANEAAALARIRSPEVVRFLAHYTEPPFIVMEYAEGMKLSSLGPLNIIEALEISASICSGLSAAHDSGVIHRDLKAEHVILTESGPKIIDFGYCKIIGQWDYAKESGHPVGTAEYMAPELTRSGNQFDHRADIYSLGIILYRIISGEFPFEDEDPDRVLKMHRYDEPMPIMNFADVPQRVWDIINKALKKNPEDRFQSAPEMRSDILSALASL